MVLIRTVCHCVSPASNSSVSRQSANVCTSVVEKAKEVLNGERKYLESLTRAFVLRPSIFCPLLFLNQLINE